MGLSQSGGLDPGKIRVQRLTTGSVGGGATKDVVVNWSPVFVDNNYTVVTAVVSPNNRLRVVRLPLTPLAGSATTRVINDDTLNAETGTIHAIAIHD